MSASGSHNQHIPVATGVEQTTMMPSVGSFEWFARGSDGSQAPMSHHNQSHAEATEIDYYAVQPHPRVAARLGEQALVPQVSKDHVPPPSLEFAKGNTVEFATPLTRYGQHSPGKGRFDARWLTHPEVPNILDPLLTRKRDVSLRAAVGYRQDFAADTPGDPVLITHLPKTLEDVTVQPGVSTHMQHMLRLPHNADMTTRH